MKIAILPIILLFFVLSASAQFQLAPVAGMNISKIHYSNKANTEISYHNINGLMVGLNAKYAPAGKFNAQLEGAFSQKGFEATETYMTGLDPSKLNRITLRINYLDFMALGEYSINNIMNLNFGGNFGIPMELYDGLDIGLIGGLKFYIGQFFVRTIYQYGINPMDTVLLTNENGQPTGEANIHNRTFQIALGYYIQ